MKLRILAAAALVLMTTSLAQAAFNADEIAAQYQADGYTRIEIKIGVSTAKVEAFKGTTKIEIIYDIATGNIVKSESATFATAPTVTPGVFVRSDDRRGDDDLDDDNDDHRRDRGSDDHGGGDDDDHDDDHGGSGRQ